MPEQFLHGVEVLEIDAGPRPIATVRSAVIGMVGTAPDSQGEVKASLLSGAAASNNALTWTSKLEGVLGNKISVQLKDPRANNSALDVSVTDQAIVVSLATNGSGVITTTGKQLRTAIAGDTEANALVGVANTGGGGAAATSSLTSNAVSSIAVTDGGSGYTSSPAVSFTGGGGTGATAHAVLTNGVVTSVVVDAGGSGYTTAPTVVFAAPVGGSTGAGAVAATPNRYLTGGADEAFPLNTPVLVAGSRIQAAKLGSTGTLPDAMDSIFDQAGAVVIVVRVEEGEDAAGTLANVIGGVNSTSGQYEGVHAFLGAESVVGFPPRILIAPGFTHTRDSGNANAVVAELLGIADRLRAVIIADGPSTTDDDAIEYAGDFGSKRVFVVDPRVTKTDANGAAVYAYSSAQVAGLIAKSDNERGFWWSPSNQNINGIIGTERAIDFTLGDADARANLLNESKVATIIRQDGYRLWGNRTLSSDPKWAFLSVVRTADIINDSLLRAHLWAVDRNITKTYVADVIEGVKDYLRHLENIGAILGGDCWADPDLNTPDQIEQGKVYFDFDFTPPYPAEHITFRSHMVNDYIATIFD
jgi:hypothetical protein